MAESAYGVQIHFGPSNQSTAPAQTNQSTAPTTPAQTCGGDTQCHAGDGVDSSDEYCNQHPTEAKCTINKIVQVNGDLCLDPKAKQMYAMCQVKVNCSQSEPCTVPMGPNNSSSSPSSSDAPPNAAPKATGQYTSTTPSTPVPSDPKTADISSGNGNPSGGSNSPSQSQSPSTSPSPSPSGSPSATASGDPAACVSAHSAADTACGGMPPSSYSSGATGINDSSQAYMSAMQNAANANYTWINQCTSAFNNCRNLCQNVDPSAASACANYASKVQQVAQQTQQNINDYQAASAAQQASVDAPPVTTPQINPSAPGCANDPTGALCQMCSADPSQAACQPQPQGNVGFKDDSVGSTPTGSANFAIPDPGTLMQQVAAYQNQNPYAQQQAMAGVPQGGGGGIGAGASGPGAKLGDARRGGYAPPSGNRADIMQGERGGGFAGYGAGPQNTDEFSNYGRYNTRNARGPANARGDGGYLGMDLKRYLPGGMFDPGRQIGGMFRRSNSEIMGQTADLFRHISDRMQERCRLGLLYDCR